MVILLLFSIIAQAILKYSKADVARGHLCFKFQSCWVWIDGVALYLVKCSLLMLSGSVMFSRTSAKASDSSCCVNYRPYSFLKLSATQPPCKSLNLRLPFAKFEFGVHFVDILRCGTTELLKFCCRVCESCICLSGKTSDTASINTPQYSPQHVAPEFFTLTPWGCTELQCTEHCTELF